jgi:hypothetical protein
MSYTNIFGGYNVNTAFPSYATYTFGANLQLNWASSFVDYPPGINNVTAQNNDLNATAMGLTVTLADATLISTGQQIQFNNVGANPITINNFSGGFLATIPPTNNNQYILYLQDNTTQAGTWGITHLGAGTSSADASVLAGLGTVALNSQINTNFPGKTIGANYQVQLSDRASILVWTGGAGTITLPDQLAGFYIAVNNEGSGIVTINTPDDTTIDGAENFSLNPSESCYFIGVGVAGNWNTLGFGVESYFQVNVLSTNLSAVNPSITLTAQQSSRLVQTFTGALANNVTVYFPAAPGQWYVWNDTSNAYTVMAQLAGPTGNSVILPQGQKVILYSDGNSIYNTPTIATSATFPDGNVGAPGINFASDATTGFYKPATPPAGVVNYSAAGTASLSFGGTAAGYELAFVGTNNVNYVGFKAGAAVANTVWTLPLADSAGSQALYSNGAGVLSWMTPGSVSSVSGTANEITVTNPTTTPVISIANTYVGQASITTLGTVTTGTWNATPLTVPYGGTGLNTLTTAYGVVCAGTTATGNLQNAGAGTANQVLTSNGAAALPSWQSINIALPFATKAQQIAASSSAVYTSPMFQQNHPSAAKAWVRFATNGTMSSSYNVSNVVPVSPGIYTINFTTAFANTNYVCIPNIEFGPPANAAGVAMSNGASRTTTSIQIYTYGTGFAAADVGIVDVAFYGLQ